MNWANRLTIARIVLVPFFVAAILYNRLTVALLFFVAATVTDGLDGYIARRFDQQTRFGAMLDPIADKMLIGSAFICFSIVSGLPEYLKLPIYVPVIIISRDVLILMGAFMLLVSPSGIKVKPTILGKLTTVAQMSTVIVLLLKAPWSIWFWNTACVLSVASGVDYLRVWSGQINGKI